MTYAPDPLKHTALSDRAALWCGQDGVYCTPLAPCPCCGPPDAAEGDQATSEAPEDKAPAPVPDPAVDPLPERSMEAMAPPPARDQAPRPAAVRMVVDGDAGVAGETHG